LTQVLPTGCRYAITSASGRRWSCASGGDGLGIAIPFHEGVGDDLNALGGALAAKLPQGDPAADARAEVAIQREPSDEIEMATLNGAKALGIGETTGSVTAGKRADLILIRGNDVNIAPIANPETSVVQGGSPANVDTVIVDGRIVKRGGRLVAYDIDKIVREAKESALRIRAAAGGRLAPPPTR
jgi:hypothetical protein